MLGDSEWRWQVILSSDKTFSQDTKHLLSPGVSVAAAAEEQHSQGDGGRVHRYAESRYISSASFTALARRDFFTLIKVYLHHNSLFISL